MEQQPIEPVVPEKEFFDALRVLQDYCFAAAKARGFHDEPPASSDVARAERIGNRLLLIVSEITEAQDELRQGFPPTLTYYTEPGSPTQHVSSAGGTRKPEGFPSELADVLIRLLDLAGEVGVDLAEITEEKIRYNASRAHKHGKAF